MSLTSSYNYGNYPYYPQNNNPGSRIFADWVQGVPGANAYPVAAGARVFLFDSTEDKLYVKSADQYGKPLPLEEYALSKIEPEPIANAETDNFSKEELAAFIAAKVGEELDKRLPKARRKTEV